MAVAIGTPVRDTALLEDRGVGRSGSYRNESMPRAAERLPEADRIVWLEAYDDALARGAGRNVASFFANQRLRRLQETRDGIEIPGARDYAAYR